MGEIFHQVLDVDTILTIVVMDTVKIFGRCPIVSCIFILVVIGLIFIGHDGRQWGFFVLVLYVVDVLMIVIGFGLWLILDGAFSVVIIVGMELLFLVAFIAFSMTITIFCVFGQRSSHIISVGIEC